MKKTDLYTTLLIISLAGFQGCTSKPQKHYDGATLLQTKCASCHNLDMPPKTYEDEKAPPMMAVAFHVKDFMKVATPTDKKPKFIEFFKDYVLNPSAEKSFCDKKSLESYGIMPSQKGNVTEDEVGAIAEYVFDFYDQEKFLKQMKEHAAFHALPLGQQIATQKGCLTCHGITKRKAAPAFSQIATKPKKEIQETILQGSHGKWKGFERMTMPSYQHKITQNELNTLVKWIISKKAP
jgi:cytochrome c